MDKNIIIKEVAKAYGVGASDIFGSSRQQNIAYARHTFALLCSYLNYESYDEIGRFINRDRATVRASIQQAQSLLLYKDFRKTFMQIMKYLLKKEIEDEK